MSSDNNNEKRGGVTLPQMPEDEDAKWTRHFTRAARRHTHANAVAPVDDDDGAEGGDASPADDIKDENEGAHQQQQQRQHRQAAAVTKVKKESKAQSEFRTLQLSLESYEGVVEVLQNGLMCKKMTPLFSEHKNLAVFFQALLSNPSSAKSATATASSTADASKTNENENDENDGGDDAKQQAQEQHQQQQQATFIPRPAIVKSIIKTCKPHVWSLLSLLNAFPRGSPLPSPCLKFIALCDANGVATDKWASTIGISAHAAPKEWNEPALPPRPLLRALESRCWYECLCSRVAVLECGKDVIKFCLRILNGVEAAENQKSKRAKKEEAAAAAKDNKEKADGDDDDDEDKDDDDDQADGAAAAASNDEEEEQEAALMESISAPKLSQLASTFASKLVRDKEQLFATDEERRRNTITTAADCLDALTRGLRALTTLKKVSHACNLMLEMLPPADAGTKEGADDDDDNDEASSVNMEQCRATLETVAQRCNGGGSETDVAMAAAKQLGAVAKFKGAKTAADVSAAVDEIVNADGTEVEVLGDDVISSMAVAVNTLLGPQKKAVQFAVQEELDLEDELAAELRGTKKQSKKKSAAAAAAAAAAAPAVSEQDEEAKVALQKRAMLLLEREVLVGRRLPRRAQTFLDRCKQELRRRERK